MATRYLYPTLNTVGFSTFPAMVSYLDFTSPQTIVAEQHRIPTINDAVIDLALIPKASEDPWNTFVDLPTLQAIGFTVTVDADPRTLQATLPPAVGSVCVDIARWPLSTRLYFNDADRGKLAAISYKGLYSLADSAIINAHSAAIQRLEQFPWLQMLSALAWSDGAYDGSNANDKTFFVTPFPYRRTWTDGSVRLFEGATYDCDAGGNFTIAAFTNANYWKRVVVSLDYEDGWITEPIESPEVASKSNLVTPTYPPQRIALGYIDVQNDGTVGVAGAILPIQQTDIHSDLSFPPQNAVCLTFRYNGILEVGYDFDAPMGFGAYGLLLKAHLSLKTPGTTGNTRVSLLRHAPGVAEGVELFADDGSKPVIAGGSPVYSSVSALVAAFKPAELFFEPTHIFRPVFDQVAEGSRDASLVLWAYLTGIA